MHIETLESLVVLATTGSYSLAARKLFVTQPTLTRRIQTLEAELGCPLVRRTMPISLTDQGEQLLPLIGEVVSAYDALRERSDRLKSEKIETISIQEISHVAPIADLVVTHAGTIVARHPSVRFKYLEPDAGRDLFSLIEDKDLDLCFTGVFGDEPELEGRITSKDVGFRLVEGIRAHLAFVVGSDNPILADPPRTLSDMRDFRFRTPLSPALRFFQDSFAMICKEHGFEPKFDYRPLENHRFFFSQELGSSAIISSVSDEGAEVGPTPLASQRKNMTLIEIPDIAAHTVLLYNKTAASQTLLEFVDLLAST